MSTNYFDVSTRPTHLSTYPLIGIIYGVVHAPDLLLPEPLLRRHKPPTKNSEDGDSAENGTSLVSNAIVIILAA